MRSYTAHIVSSNMLPITSSTFLPEIWESMASILPINSIPSPSLTFIRAGVIGFGQGGLVYGTCLTLRR